MGQSSREDINISIKYQYSAVKIALQRLFKFTHVTGTQKCEYTCFQNILTSFSIGGGEGRWEERGKWQ